MSEKNYVVVKRQDEVSVYPAEDGLVAIVSTSWPDEDQCILVPREHIPALIAALEAAAGEQ